MNQRMKIGKKVILGVGKPNERTGSKNHFTGFIFPIIIPSETPMQTAIKKEMTAL